MNENRCETVGQFCIGDEYTRGVCFACGLAVCGKCSTVRLYYSYGRKRICNGCERDHFADGETRVLARLYLRAGYGGGSYARCMEISRADLDGRDADRARLMYLRNAA